MARPPKFSQRVSQARQRARQATARPSSKRRALTKTQRKTDHKQSHVEPVAVAAEDGPAFIPKPVHFRLLSAYEGCFQDGIPPSDGVIAKRLGVCRETINRWRRRNPRLRAWLFEQIGRYAAELKPFVDRRVAQQAIAGSPDAQKLFYTFVAKVGMPPGEDGDAPPVGTAFTMNFLIPRPETPVIPGVTVREVAPQIPDNIPTVEVPR